MRQATSVNQSMARNPSNSPDYSLLAAFGAGISRPKPLLFYQFGLVLVAGAVILLPLVYLALVGGAACLVYYHAVHHWTPIMHWGGVGGRIMLIKLFIYLVPLLAGLVVVFFLFKPLLARRPKRAQPLALNPIDNPLLYAFIARICDLVGAPAPTRIDLDCQVNAAAGFRRGFLSLFGKDLVLTIGLPLAANLTASEMAGVIAHEFGHFTQGTAMRFSYVIRSIIQWFARVAYERDAWDEILESWLDQEEEVWVAIIVAVIQVAVWFSRLILKMLMFIGVVVGGFMLRQMEYDADAYEIKVAGSQAFERTTRKLATLDAAMSAAAKQLAAAWEQNGTLPDNLPEVLRKSHETLPPHVIQRINDRLGLQRTSVFDSHPSPADRIRRARQADDAGIFHDERPASELFASFEHPARFVTWLHYTDDLGIPITQQMLTHVGDKAPRGAASTPFLPPAAGEESDRWTFGLLPFLLPLSVNGARPSADAAADFSELAQLTAGLEQVATQLGELGTQKAALSEKLASARAAQCVLGQGVVLQSDLLGPRGITTDLAVIAEKDALQGQKELRHSLHEVIPVLHRRLELGLALALANADSTDVDELRGKIDELSGWLNQNAADFSRKQAVAGALETFDKINAVKVSQGECPALTRALVEQEAAVVALAEGPRPQSEALPAGRLRVQLNRGSDPASGQIARIREQNQNWLAQYHRKVGDLIAIAASVETVDS